MPISFHCDHCGKRLKAPDHAAGRTAACPKCGATILCPEPIYEAEEVDAEGLDIPEILDDDDDNMPEILDDGPGDSDAVPETRRPCPMCGEPILARAVMCRFCGEVFDAKLKKGRRSSGPGGFDPDDERLSALDWLVVCLSCSGVGCFVSLAFIVMYMSQGKPKGLKMLAALGVYLVAVVLVALLIVALRSASASAS